jgi:uncharacterized protein (DUF433 family)
MSGVSDHANLLDRPVYGTSQVDRLLSLTPGTARRWIDGYVRGGRFYEPVIRPERTGEDVVTWGEFVETRLLAEYRGKNVPMIRMRPAIMRLRELLGTRYPLAHAKPFVDGRELVLAVQDDVALDASLRIVIVVRTGQTVLAEPAQHFVDTVEFGEGADPTVVRLRPREGSGLVVIDPLRQFGEPVVRSVPTEVIAEQIRAGDRLDMVADLYELSRDEVEAAVRYELTRVAPIGAAA